MATTNTTQQVPSATTIDSHQNPPVAEPMETSDESHETINSQTLPERPTQKNKKKCWVCRAKLELAQRELGHCKCGMSVVLCTLVCPFTHYNNGCFDIHIQTAWHIR